MMKAWRNTIFKDNLLMEKNKFHQTLLTGLTLMGASLFTVPQAVAGSCSASNFNGCPVVTGVTHQSGNNYTANWVNESTAQSWISASGNSTMVWGLYLITNYQSAGHDITSGTYTPIMTVTRDDPATASGGGDYCNSTAVNDPNGQYCDHANFAARFLVKYGTSGAQSVSIPTGATNSCIVFGVPRRGGGSFMPVYTGLTSVPVCGPGGINVVEPEPDPEWCGMSTSALTFDFGDMAPATVSGSTLSHTAVMDCSKAGVTYSLYLSNVTTAGRNTIDLGRGVTATVSANNQALQTNRTSTGISNSLNVTVTLNGTPTSTGAISGTGILAVTYL